MAFSFTLGLSIYYLIFLRRNVENRSTLALLLWTIYLCLGLSGIILGLTDGIQPIFDPNYYSTLILFIGIALSISGFNRFRSQDISKIFGRIRYQGFIEMILIISQLFAISYFLPFAVSSLTGDANENRQLLDEKMQIMSSYGLINTFAGAASQLFSVSIVLAFIRLAEKNHGQHIFRALLLLISSLSFVIYILAYVGRDGIIYWLMTALMIFIIFRHHLDVVNRKLILIFGLCCLIILLVPFFVITVARFFDADQGAGWSLFEYFGSQIHNFSDYSSIDRPITFGVQSFPIFVSGGCTILRLDCPSWDVIKDVVFYEYLSQGKAPWLFGTFVSDLVGDFGNIGALIILLFFSIFCSKICSACGSNKSLSLSRLLLIVFLFLTPYWGVFYFRFSIANGFILFNLIFILFIFLLQRTGTKAQN